ncbi:MULTISPECIES: peroxide stress protein YaaA [Pacificibacter]|uniref:peroxide stress protein YaaA n=1 Tax=Pacificibacter TaxID=1042323 RepID=UPI001C0894DB|nr:MULTISPECIES: peroxide stress protein YaaA [Pacificibacter]MBU2935422.1 peroxide stress protein YaaA [Pacificibacter marinus]MDO6615576.1 peroxide stress protein YaaA [Pacificibacter sp. 1_MG-2023]
MLAVISPAKKLNMDPVVGIERTTPSFTAETKELIEIAQQLDVAALRKLMGISEKLAELNVERFSNFSDTPDVDAVKQAMYMFDGDTYTGLDAVSFDADTIPYAQDHLRILSGLYGILRPLDAIQAYRLEMGSRLASPKGKNLYAFWGDKIAHALNDAAKASQSEFVVNCASTEYFSVVKTDVLTPKVITPVFLERRDGAEKTISFYAKKARGAMARFVIENRIREVKHLRDFDSGGYAFDAAKSDAATLVFSRDS